MKIHTLTATSRTVTGRKVKRLRQEKKIPATVYGKGVKSISITLSRDDFEQVYAKAGETGLVELAVGSEKRPVLIHTVQRHPVSDALLHIEFHQVDLKEKVHAKIPIELIGESPAVIQRLGVLLTVLDTIEVEALPADLPEKITVDTSMLTEVNQELNVNDLTIPSRVTVLTDSGLTVVKVGPLVTKEAEAQAAAETAAAQVAAATTAETTPSTEAPAETAKQQEEVKPKEEKKEKT